MSTALLFVDPESTSTSRLRDASRRVAGLPSLHVGAALLSVLLGGLLLSIATTRDPLWWQLHFSQLGIFGDFSSILFNSTLKVSGALVMVFALYVRRDIVRFARGAVRRGSGTLAYVCLNTVGVNLALVGCVPLNTDKDLHDRVAGLMVLGFLALLISAPFMLRGLGARMAISTGVALVWLIMSITLFVTATINLALFETISCSAMFAWSGMLTHTLGLRRAGAASRSETPGERVACRGMRRALTGRRPLAGLVLRRADQPRRRSGVSTRPTASDRPSVHPATPTARRADAPSARSTGRRPDPSTSSRARFAAGCSRAGDAPQMPRDVSVGRPRPAVRASRGVMPPAGGYPRRASAIEPSPRRRPRLRPRAVSAARGTRDGSPAARRRPPAPPRRHRARPVAPGVARSLPR